MRNGLQKDLDTLCCTTALGKISLVITRLSSSPQWWGSSNIVFILDATGEFLFAFFKLLVIKKILLGAETGIQLSPFLVNSVFIRLYGCGCSVVAVKVFCVCHPHSQGVPQGMGMVLNLFLSLYQNLFLQQVQLWCVTGWSCQAPFCLCWLWQWWFSLAVVIHAVQQFLRQWEWWLWLSGAL